MPELGNDRIDIFTMGMEFQTIMGSTAYGLAVEGKSDLDMRGWFTFLPEDILSLYPGEKETRTRSVPNDEQYWEIKHFLKLALKGNPSVLECLWVDESLIRLQSASAQKLRKIRNAFISKQVISSYGGYALQQLGRGEEALGVRLSGHANTQDHKHRSMEQIEHGWKNISHLFRLLIAGVELMKTGEVMVNVGTWRDWLLKVKTGQIDFIELAGARSDLEAQFSHLKHNNDLPESPNWEAANTFLLELRRGQIQDAWRRSTFMWGGD